MRHLLSILIFTVITLQGFSQKVNIKIIKTLKAGLSEWQVLDDQYRQIFSDTYYYREDTIFLALEAEKRYFLQLSVNEITIADTNLVSLYLDGNEIISVRSDIGYGDHFFPFFTGVKQEISKIIGGVNADIADFPWQVYVRAGNYMCGGIIIAPEWILTAAHCVKNDDGTTIPASDMRIRAGASNPYTGPYVQYLVGQVIVHENYSRPTLTNDIALLKLQSPVTATNALPIRLVTSGDAAEGYTDPGVMTWVTGWGLTNVNPEISPVILQKVQLPIVSNETASAVWSSIPPNVIMAGYRDGNKETCSGDSGGPMVVEVSGEYKVAGIVSWGNTTCSTYSGFTRVSAFETWIRSKTGITEFTPPVPSGDELICEGIYSGSYSVPPVAGATSYDWELYPDDAGLISGTSSNATVTWNSKYSGDATVKLRVTVAGKISEWSRLYVVLAKNTKIISQSGNKTLCPGESFTLSIGAEGDDLKYTWYKNGTQLVNISNEIKVTNASIGQSGVYTCRIEGSCGTLISSDMNVIIHPETKITLTTPDTTVKFGDELSLRVKAEGHDLSYSWEKNGGLIPITGSTQVIENANSGDIGIYRVAVNGTCGDALSSKFYLYVINEYSPDVSLWPTITSTDFNTALSTDDIYSIRIYSGLGKLMKELTGCRYQTTVDIRNFPRGLYIVKVYNKDISLTRRVVKD